MYFFLRTEFRLEIPITAAAVAFSTIALNQAIINQVKIIEIYVTAAMIYKKILKNVVFKEKGRDGQSQKIMLRRS